jgi:hypothetical protein
MLSCAPSIAKRRFNWVLLAFLHSHLAKLLQVSRYPLMSLFGLVVANRLIPIYLFPSGGVLVCASKVLA